MSRAQGAPLDASVAEGPDPLGFLRHALAVAGVEARKFRRDPIELLTRAVQPALWLLVFGQVFGRIKGIPTDGTSYLSFVTPGVLAQSVVFSAIHYGMTIIWEGDLGVLQKVLASPASRGALVLGKTLAAGVRGLAHTAVIYVLALAVGVDLHVGPRILGVLVAVVLGSATFAAFSIIVACLVRTRDRFTGIGQLMTMPLFLASNAIYPIDIMPPWLRAVSRANPLTYLVDALRVLMVQNGQSSFGPAVDFAVLLGTFVVLLWIAAWLYPTIVR